MKKRLLFIAVLFLTGVTIFSSAQQAVVPATALQHYIHNGDPAGGWEVRDSYTIEDVRIYSILLISQKWQGILWKHELVVCVPKEVDKDGALLFITGSSVNDGMPRIAKKDDEMSTIMAAIAAKNKAVIAILRQVPNQPLYNGLTEDALISYTLNEFKKGGDYSWPLLFPMVKSALKAMDAVQEFAPEYAGREIAGFVVSGASKRGWTTWLTGASKDPRVWAIAPMVIDMLNMPATLDYQKELYGEYSEEIQDYVKLEIPQAVHSEFGNAIVSMIDPYSYRKDLAMPKLIFMGTNDPYWTVDAVKHYLDGIPGQNYLHYVPNAGHGLGDKIQAMTALNSFLALTLAKAPYPTYSWELAEKGKKIRLTVHASPKELVKASLWTAQSDSRDFREAKWTATDIPSSAGKPVVEAALNYPAKGYQAFYVQLTYEDINGDEYALCTRVYVADKKQVFVK
ncbi:MAG: PhoPQ-activated pathogenicity-related family protein [Tannerellaceae bacterium]|jgi:PhoPQ-activated pathogenicity-related protein|nr:PhoPQ-activated pathogenicity-related family protein [Tannerellaceae bacterium]